MRSSWVAVFAVLCATNIAFGWLLGYRTPGVYVAFWALAALLVWTASLASSAFAPVSTIDAWIRTGVLAFAVVVLCALALGAARALTLGAFFAAEVACLGAALTLLSPRAARPGEVDRPPLPVFVVAIVGAVLTLGVAYAVTHAPLTLYDSVSYHLFFSARWLQDHAISIIPTPFSDEAQAYAPGNGELSFLWLMLPFHGDLLARFGELPFALLAAATLYALARRLGAPPQHAAYPSAFFLLSRPVLEQTVGADVDVVCTAMFLASIYFGLIAVDRGQRRDWLLWGISLGLYAGTKYVALVYLPVFVLLAFARGARARILWAVPGLAAFALPWYLRNWVVAGSPIYPASLAIGGLTIARGAFTRSAMFNTVFHTNNLRLFPIIAARGFGPTLFLVWIPAAILGGAAMLRRGWWPNRLLVLVMLVMVPLYWFGFPVNTDPRFLMPAISLSLVPFAFTFRTPRAWNAGVHAAYGLGLLWIVVGLRAEIPATAPWYMGGWLAMNGLMTPAFGPLFAAVAALAGITWWAGSRRPRAAIPLLVCVCAASAGALAVGGARWCDSGCDYLDITSPYIRPNLLQAWRWLDDHIANATIAYTGINLPYPLTGDRLTNRVVYANIDGHPRWRLHDYDRAYRAGLAVPIPALATSSGELMPVVQHDAIYRTDAIRPRYERMDGRRDSWIGNLHVLGVTHVFIAALSAYEIDSVWHNDRGFPIEDDWAGADPSTFQLVYENGQARVFAVAPGH